ncbi:MAG: NAD(P)-dependent oxidoreductase [Planctomycetota bacterium]|nr:NAD(P)-dependent oxidoreductase [Planctomycetota bacterium]
METKIRKVFITGGCGFVGSYLARELLKQGFELLLFDAFINFIDPFESNYQFFLKARMDGLRDKVRIERGDIRVQKRMQQLMNEWLPDATIHLAALPSAKESTLYPTEALQINVDGTLSVLEGVKACGSVKRFIFTSSSFVYGNFKRDIADEEHPTEPIDVYGGTKLTGEILTRAYAKQHGFEYVIVRPSAVYGFGDCNRRVTQIMIENAMRGKPLVLHGGGRSRIDFTYVTDLAGGFARALTAPAAANETFNVTRGNARSVREFALEVKKHFPSAELIEKPSDTSRPERGTLSIEKARKLLGYDPKVDIEQGVAEYVAQLKARGPK